ncbi:class I SAM-dependent methyltransferase [Glutamicibacter sp.]
MANEPVVDANFTDELLARLYDPLDPDRSDLETYTQLITALDAHKILDVGCGTGTFACTMAAAGFEVTGVDPADASLAVARKKPAAARVHWVHGTVHDLPTADFDAAVMTANVAMVFTDDAQWQNTLQRIALALKPEGTLIFEARRPELRAWERWTEQLTRETTMVAGQGAVTTWVQVLGYANELLRFRETFRFEDGTELISESTLRYRSREHIEATLNAAGFDIRGVYDAPDRPGRQFIFVAQRRLNG